MTWLLQLTTYCTTNRHGYSQLLEGSGIYQTDSETGFLWYVAIWGALLRWIKSFLTNHTQQVVVSEEYSSPYSVTSGTPGINSWACSVFIVYKQYDYKYSKPNTFVADNCLLYRTYVHQPMIIYSTPFG